LTKHGIGYVCLVIIFAFFKVLDIGVKDDSQVKKKVKFDDNDNDDQDGGISIKRHHNKKHKHKKKKWY